MSSERVRPYEEKMQKSLAHLEEDLQSVRAGRANPHILDKVKVDYYGSLTPLQQVANISAPEARIIQIQPWDKKLVKEIQRAIQMEDIGINPTTDGTTVRLIFPELTEERRKQIAKEVKKQGDEAKVNIRNIRRDGNDEFKKLKKSAELSEDVVSDLEDELQKIHDKYIKDIDAVVDKKCQEVMKV